MGRETITLDSDGLVRALNAPKEGGIRVTDATIDGDVVRATLEWDDERMNPNESFEGW